MKTQHKERFITRGIKYWTVLCGVVVFATSGITIAKSPSDQTEGKPIVPELEQLSEAVQLLKAIRRQIDRSQFDRNELIDRLDFDDKQIIAFARDQIAFEAYPGLLRGSDGTLQSGAGNALDQSVFLAAMLRDAGFDARIVEGKITAEDAARLVSGIQAPRNDRSPFKDENQVQQLISQLGGLVQGGDSDTGSEQVVPVTDLERVRSLSKSMVSKIRDSGVDIGGGIAKWEDIVKQSQTYYWVQYRNATSSPWQDLHPAFGDRTSPTASDSRYFVGEVPEDLLHKIRFTAYISQNFGDSLTDRPVMSTWERPIANLVGTTLKYVSYPDGLAREGENKETFDETTIQLRNAIDASRFFHPMLNDQLAPGAKFFDHDGNSLPPDVASSYLSGLFQEVSGNIGNAISALSNPKESDDDVMSLVAHWIEIELASPDGESRKINRYLLTPDRESETRTLALTREVSISVEPGRISMAKFLDNSLALLTSAAEALIMLYEPDSTTRPESAERLIETLTSLASGVRNRDYLVATNNLAHAVGAVSVYRPRAAVVATYRSMLGMANEPSVPEGFDILADFNFVWVEDGDSIAKLGISPDKTVELGVAQTMLESLARLPGAVRGANAFLNWDESNANEIVVMAASSDYRNWAEADTTSFMLRDIEAGNLAVTQEDLLTNGSPSIWWKINPDTAETLGMNYEGWGGLRYFPMLSLSFEYKMFMDHVKHMVGPARAAGAVAECHAILGALSLGEQVSLVGEQAGHVNTTLGAIIQGTGATMQLAERAVWTPRGYEAFMRKCVIRQIWK